MPSTQTRRRKRRQRRTGVADTTVVRAPLWPGVEGGALYAFVTW